MNCPNCGSALDPVPGKDHLICGACRALHFPAPDDQGICVLGEWSAQLCPVCHTPLISATHTHERLLYCPSCRGMLLPMSGFGRLVESLRARANGPPLPPAPITSADLVRPAPCPGCGAPMDTHLYGGPGNIVIDNCPECRLNWLDYGELARISHAADPAASPGAWLPP